MSESILSVGNVVIQQIPVSQIRPSSHQIRKNFEEGSIRSLAESIDKEGLIQPITVRKMDDFYELVAGERRLRAVKSLRWETIEARVIQVPSEAAASAKGLVENLQREDLNPLEEAEGFAALNQMDSAYWTHERIANIAGKDRTYITKSMGFLSLPDQLRSDNVLRSTFTRNHLIQICRISDQEKQNKVVEAIKKGLNVEETRKLVDGLLADTKPAGKSEPSPDPLGSLWPTILSNRAIEAMGGWVVNFKKDHWNFSVSQTAVHDKESLIRWFRQMAEVLSMEASDPNPSAGASGHIREPADLLPSTSEELELMVKEQRQMRLPQTAREEAELQSLAQKGPQLVYAWIYGGRSLLARKVGNSTWADFGISDPKEALKKLIEAMRKIQSGDIE